MANSGPTHISTMPRMPSTRLTIAKAEFLGSGGDSFIILIVVLFSTHDGQPWPEDSFGDERNLSRLQPFHEPLDCRALGVRFHLMAGVFLDANCEMIVRACGTVGFLRGAGTFLHPGQRRVRVGIAVDQEQWAWRN